MPAERRSRPRTPTTWAVASPQTWTSPYNGSGQGRAFTYDNRGFLNWERHPEKGSSGNGTVNYSDYDARGHAGRRREGVANGDFDIQFAYDQAERLTAVKETRLTAGAHRLLKSSAMATASWPLTAAGAS